MPSVVAPKSVTITAWHLGSKKAGSRARYSATERIHVTFKHWLRGGKYISSGAYVKSRTKLVVVHGEPAVINRVGSGDRSGGYSW